MILMPLAQVGIRRINGNLSRTSMSLQCDVDRLSYQVVTAQTPEVTPKACANQSSKLPS